MPRFVVRILAQRFESVAEQCHRRPCKGQQMVRIGIREVGGFAKFTLNCSHARDANRYSSAA
ncbi:hypothetical protein DF156_21940 [Burkholderia ubonensis]|nr:hypothetical protein CJO67_30680 [Burkholderia ubonensis]RQP33149.1 hypothetical protein DF155_17900 [Burkholderia ubonensis]RQP36689.1 hypothetical protein DF154_20900 [Burkholderia ubonensis]RQP37012.1 hypothetical protein DF156_21940 [Burkholderia ubonensis]RQP51718.1 hypothetical protein DF144_20545 [Burkholderia ubonensis]